MNKLLAPALIAAAASACASSDEYRASQEANPAPCPNIVVLSEAARFIDFEGQQAAENITYSGEIVDVGSACRYYTDNPIEMEVSIDLAFGRGPKATDNQKVFKYFVAVTRTNSEVIAKKEFAVPIEWDDDEDVQVKRVDVDEIVIPRRDENISGLNFEVIVGFAVTPEQAIYNRSGKSLKFPNIK
ncbi:hypothetical protein PUV54_15780 [Hyphococcus flavus]|uniref:DUF4352 domain-containing protein n=1 Tax=Hyphococcus flavus TaxID=1866326 RepID=A0AAE9ZJ58_9PROT|nr:hypothetical protein [Hyphococcus flavus]WDI31410.1 hypothetical protein PUV54_15780 [Hyphococcus flavus]